VRKLRHVLIGAHIPVAIPSLTVDVVREGEIGIGRQVGTTVDDLGSVGPGSAELQQELAAVHRRILGRAPTDDELAGLVEFWEQAEALGGAEAAWMAVVGLGLRAPDFWSY